MPERILTVKSKGLKVKPVTVPLCPLQIPHGLMLAQTQASAVRRWWLASWAVSRPYAVAVGASFHNRKIRSVKPTARHPPDKVDTSGNFPNISFWLKYYLCVKWFMSSVHDTIVISMNLKWQRWSLVLSSALKMEVICSSETLVITRPHSVTSPEDHFWQNSAVFYIFG